MRILVSNDDGIYSSGLWALVKRLKEVGEVIVVAPDREQSATGTQVTLRQPLRVQKTHPLISGIEAYSVEGSPCDCVILGLAKLIAEPVDLVVSGINHGLNLGDDVLISGTVGAALQGYLRSIPSIAISIPVTTEEPANLDSAACITMEVARRIKNGDIARNSFLNINIPDLPLSRINELRVTPLAHKTHIETVEEGHDGRKRYFWLRRRQLSPADNQETDIWAIENGYISISALHERLFQQPSFTLEDAETSGILKAAKDYQERV
ncbi:5'/3'-nucleotidase SurE [Dehalococcoides mccartyi]|uniref:5'-nucleotidase SurE n=1 Tax=Dehalococcoides mccartyi (strain VS) TaxID=311424 RepID=D2BHP0_DEHMV|nr:5'/3'-nucleotidase SurE [Dehalococcoides mccartyi]ACZ61840.1 stationary-phase survival protein [Dehalococcoides mccartyi VS]